MISTSEMSPAVFFDRDGTLIEDVGIFRDRSGIRLFPDTLEALRELREHYLFFVVSNQSAVADGLLSVEEVERVNGALDALFRTEGIRFQDWYFCPHRESDRCSCRKPGHGFLLEAADAHRVDLKRSFIIGDHPHDAATGRALGVTGLYLLTGHGRKHLPEVGEDVPVFDCLRDAASWIGGRGRGLTAEHTPRERGRKK